MNIQDVRLDIDKSPSVGKWVTIGQGDKSGTTIVAHIFDHGVAATLTGMTARFEMRMPNATYFEDANCTIDGNVITYVVDESHAALYAGGESVAYFALYEGETAIYSTERFHVRVARAASDGANPGHAWTNGIEEWLEDASGELDGYVANANSRVGATINAANAAVEGMRSDVDEAISDTEEVIDRAEDAIEAMGDISEQAVPEMSADVRGGAKLEEHGGLALRDGALGIGSLVQQSDGYARGGLAEVTAKGHAEQVATTGKNLCNLGGSSVTLNGVTYTKINDSELRISGTPSQATPFNKNQHYVLAAGTYTYQLIVTGTNGNKVYPRISSGSFFDGTILVSDHDFVGTGSKTFTLESDTDVYVTVSVLSSTNVDVDVKCQLELGSTATAYEPYTGGAPSPSPDYPQEIQVVRGRNLWDIETHLTERGATFTKNGDAYTTSSDGTALYTLPLVFSDKPVQVCMNTVLTNITSTNVRVVLGNYTDGTFTSVTSGSAGIIFGVANALRFDWSRGGQFKIDGPQLTLGSTPQPYVPYGHVGMEARDPDTDELISCTALPLPSRGWVAGLPDGTADSLRLDGAGKCEWTLPCGMETFDGSSDEGWSGGGDGDTNFYTTKYKAQSNHNYPSLLASNLICQYSYSDIMANVGIALSTNALYITNGVSEYASDFTSWLSTHPVTVLYPLATPVTEDCGYVEDWPTDLPEGAVITIPELDEVGIRYFVDSTVTELARQWYARANSEYEDRLQALEEAMATIITGS